MSTPPHNSLFLSPLQYSCVNLGENKSFIRNCDLYLSSLPYNPDQMSDFYRCLWLCLLNPHKSSRWLLTDGPPSIQRRAFFPNSETLYLSRSTASFLSRFFASGVPDSAPDTLPLSPHLVWEMCFLIIDRRWKNAAFHSKSSIRRHKRRARSKRPSMILVSGSRWSKTHVYVHTNKHTHTRPQNYLLTFSNQHGIKQQGKEYSGLLCQEHVRAHTAAAIKCYYIWGTRRKLLKRPWEKKKKKMMLS